MPERQYTEFRPRWARDDYAQYESLGDAPDIAHEPDSVPRLPTRIVPVGGGSSISALTLTDAVSTTQRIMNYASYETVMGIHQNFADLRRIDSDLLRLAKLDLQPFDEGSFIIAAELTDATLEIPEGSATRIVTSHDVLKRFIEIFEGVNSSGHLFQTCIGAIQAIEELGKILKRDAERIEFRPRSMRIERHSNDPLIVDAPFIQKVSTAKLQRLDPRSAPEALDGTLVAVDLARMSLRIKLARERLWVRGSFTMFMQDSMIQYLGKAIRLIGSVEYRGKRPTFINALDVELTEE